MCFILWIGLIILYVNDYFLYVFSLQHVYTFHYFTAQVFDCEAFMDKFKERFLQSVDSHAIVLRLVIEKVISKKLSHSIKNQYVGDGNQELFLYLQEQADLGSIRKMCDVMVREEGYAMMNELGRDIRSELDLLTGMHVHVVM